MARSSSALIGQDITALVLHVLNDRGSPGEFL
jgi:hypothetical protein